MMLKVLLLLFVLIQLVWSISYTPDKKDKPKKPGCNSNAKVPTNQAELICKNVVAFYDGTFHNYRPNDMKVKFQFRLKYENRNYQGQMEHWEESTSSSKNIVWCFGDSPKYNVTGEIGISESPLYPGNNLGLKDDRYNYDYENGNRFQFLTLETRIDEGLVLRETIGQCTKADHYYEYPGVPERKLYKSCVCCGEYNPHPSLGCPTNPWASKSDC